jgi:hypothetical protein
MHYTELLVGEEYWTNDGFGYDRVRVIAHHNNHPEYPWPVVELEYIDEPGRIDFSGGSDGYAPDFYPKDW